MATERTSLFHCPIEIIADILELACTDDGSTWPSLSVVSRTFHNVSAPFKLLSLTISTFRKALAVIALIRANPPHNRRIVHLFLAFTEMPSAGRKYDGSYPLGDDILRPLLPYHYRTILWNAAPTLEYVVTDLDFVCFLQAGHVYPRLRELSVCTCSTDIIKDLAGSGTLPALRILQIQCFRGVEEERPRMLRRSLASLASVVPNLEHIRIGDALAYFEHQSSLRMLLGIVLSTPKADFAASSAGPHNDDLWRDLRGGKRPLQPPHSNIIHSVFPLLRRFHVVCHRNREARFVPPIALTLLQGLDARCRNLLVVHRPDSDLDSHRFGGDLLRTLAWQDWSVRAKGGSCGCVVGATADLPCTREMY